MAEPFSLAAGIFSALQFLDRLVVLSKMLSSSLSEESSEIRGILRELETLRSILQLFRQEIEHEQQTDGAVRRLEYLHQPVQEFEQQLTELSQCLQSLSVQKTGGVRWVFSHQKRVEKQMEKIQRFKLIFSSAFAADDRYSARSSEMLVDVLS